MLTLEHVDAGYGPLAVLHNVSVHVASGEIVALVGANGAGKTTLLRVASGLVRPTGGRVTFAGAPIHTAKPHAIVRAGLVHVPEERALFGRMTVEENLRLGASCRNTAEADATQSEVFELFPALAERRAQIAATLSGGQQQMLAIGRALMAGPKLLMLDEPSIGLAPKLVLDVLHALERIRAAGITVLLVEQNVSHALRLADRAYVLESGVIALEGTGQELMESHEVRRAYLGM